MYGFPVLSLSQSSVHVLWTSGPSLGQGTEQPFLSVVFPEDRPALSQIGRLVLLIFHLLNYSSL